MDKLVRKAIEFSVNAHKDQVRKSSKLLYYVHTISVFSIVKKFKESKNITSLLCASLLHDILEDTTITFETLVSEFNPKTASIVLELTNDKTEIEKIGKLEYMKNKLRGLSSYALTIKLADILDNISDSPNDKQFALYKELVYYILSIRMLSSTQSHIVYEILKVIG